MQGAEIMSFDSNRKDFESALEALDECLDQINGILSSEHTDTIEAVINEYEGHYSRDIDDLVTERDNLQEELDDSQQDKG